MNNEVIIKDTHRGLWYEDGVLKQVLGAGRYEVRPRITLFRQKPKVELLIVDVRERELTIKGQEILTADKVALRVSVIVQFRVTDSQAALHAVQRLYRDVQLAARRSLASMTLEEILTNRNRLSEDILRDVKESAATFGVAIVRADVKDLVFPGNLQEIMNRVLAAERNSQAQLVEARTKSEVQHIKPRAARKHNDARPRPMPTARNWRPKLRLRRLHKLNAPVAQCIQSGRLRTARLQVRFLPGVPLVRRFLLVSFREKFYSEGRNLVGVGRTAI